MDGCTISLECPPPPPPFVLLSSDPNPGVILGKTFQKPHLDGTCSHSNRRPLFPTLVTIVFLQLPLWLFSQCLSLFLNYKCSPLRMNGVCFCHCLSLMPGTGCVLSSTLLMEQINEQKVTSSLVSETTSCPFSPSESWQSPPWVQAASIWPTGHALCSQGH